MILLATIPVGIAGLALEHLFRVVFSKPVPTALFLAANGLILLAGERKRRRSALDAPPAATPAMAAQGASAPASSHAPWQPVQATTQPRPLLAPQTPTEPDRPIRRSPRTCGCP